MYSHPAPRAGAAGREAAELYPVFAAAAFTLTGVTPVEEATALDTDIRLTHFRMRGMLGRLRYLLLR